VSIYCLWIFYYCCSYTCINDKQKWEAKRFSHQLAFVHLLHGLVMALLTGGNAWFISTVNIWLKTTRNRKRTKLVRESLCVQEFIDNTFQRELYANPLFFPWWICEYCERVLSDQKLSSSSPSSLVGFSSNVGLHFKNLWYLHFTQRYHYKKIYKQMNNSIKMITFTSPGIFQREALQS